MRTIVLVLSTLLPILGMAGPLDETRYADHVVRNADGSIHRSQAVSNAFRKIHPCPATGLTTGACTGWQINHVIPLACGGADAVSNMDWMPIQIKTCTQAYCRDRFERKIYALVPAVPGSSCTTEIIK